MLKTLAQTPQQHSFNLPTNLFARRTAVMNQNFSTQQTLKYEKMIYTLQGGSSFSMKSEESNTLQPDPNNSVCLKNTSLTFDDAYWHLEDI